ncbi:MAG TPA: hypothetical protein PLJ33_08135 [Peptococcaceae bacterium]|jgi:hypothetical protein|nr:hypothetical protein [Clostridia bacterium]HOB82709.1 hypothetical protein [Peptococcaceae bacterium]HPZ71893.1 hypothetical protein [Peptococcaceae bacterium]HQD54800.1 hypothetical protein [Peptococcaceae bacterium]
MKSQHRFRMAGSCPYFDSVRSAKGLEGGNVPSRELSPRCNHCVHWQKGLCDLFLARR